MKRCKIKCRPPGSFSDTGHVQPLDTAPENKSIWQDPFVHILLILAAGFVVYFNSISVPFIFDDFVCIVNNPAIKDFACFPNTHKVMDYSLLPDIKNNMILRPVTYFTFALNYALHGLGLFGYHVVNLLLHIGCGMLVYYFFAQLMQTPAVADPEKNGAATTEKNAGYLPLFAALLFVCHPVQTQAVTYIVQRFVPLATFFYLAALVLYAGFRLSSTSTSKVVTYILSICATVLAMESKEIAFTLPAIIVLVELMFFHGAIMSRIVRLIPFLLTMAIIPVKLLHLQSPALTGKSENISNAINLVNFSSISSQDYLMTQFGVITTYIRLLLLPIRQNFDYDYPLQQNFFTPEVLLPLTLLLAIIGIALYFLRHSRENHRYKIISFGVFWFFITLSVESSIVPISDLIIEHRIYLPSVGFVISLLAGLSVLFSRVRGTAISDSRTATLVLVMMVAGLSVTAIARNMVWQDGVRFMNDIVKKSPEKARAYLGLGEALVRQTTVTPVDIDSVDGILSLTIGSDKQIESVISAYKKAIQLEPTSSDAYMKLAEALILKKDYDAALPAVATAIKLQPGSFMPYVLRGDIYTAKGDLVGARKEYLQANNISPASHVPHRRLSGIYTKEGDYGRAIHELEVVMTLFPEESTRRQLIKLKQLNDS